MRASVSLLALSFAGLACSTVSPPVYQAAHAPKSEPGFLYALPRTVFRVNYTATRADFVSPECSASADELKALGIDPADVRVKPGGNPISIYSVSDGSIVGASEPDPEAMFFTTLTQRWFTDNSLKILVGPDGVVSGADGSSNDRVGATVVKAIEIGGTIIASSLPLVVSTKAQKCEAKRQDFVALETTRNNLLKMDLPHPKDAYEFRVAELRAAQDAIRAEFIGLKKTTTAVLRCDVTPGQGATSAAILTIHAQSGIAGAPGARCRIPDELRAPATPSGSSRDVALTLELLNGSLAESGRRLDPAVLPTVAGFFYRVPGLAEVGVDGPKGIKIERNRFAVTQLGSTRSYPQVSGANPKLSFELHPDTGALKTVSLEEKGIDTPALLGAAGGATAAVLTAEKARRDAAGVAQQEEEAARAKAELNRLLDEQAILEATLAIRVAKEALAQESATK